MALGSKETCPAITVGAVYGAERVIGTSTFHDLTVILCCVFSGVVFLTSGLHVFLHATYLSRPGEQIKIIRIILMVPVFALVYLIAALFLHAAVYLQPWADLYESIALASYFLLLVTYCEPVSARQDEFFDALGHEHGKSNLRLLRRTWVYVFQYVPTSFIVALATDVTQAKGLYCANGSGIHFAHQWLTGFRCISVALAFLALLDFYRHLRYQLNPFHVVSKLTALKGIVVIDFAQRITFTVLSATNTVLPSSKLSYNDIYYGIPSIIICGVMVFFSVYHLYAYSASPYMGRSSQYQGGRFGLKGLRMALNPGEMVAGIAQAGRILVGRGRQERRLHSSDDTPSVPPTAPPKGQKAAYGQHEIVDQWLRGGFLGGL
ncbi:hypothetical protein ACLMJK_006331 [Lecanora helva]